MTLGALMLAAQLMAAAPTPQDLDRYRGVSMDVIKAETELRWRDGLKLARKQVAMAGKLFGKASEQRVDAMSSLARLSGLAGSLTKALVHYKAAAELADRVHGAASTRAWNAWGAYADQLFELKRVAEAEAIFSRNQKARTKRFGPAHVSVMVHRVLRAKRELRRRDFVAVEATYAKVLEHANGRPEYVREAMYGLAISAWRQGEAELTLKRVQALLDASTKSLGPAHPQTVGYHLMRGDVLTHLGRKKEAAPHYAKVEADYVQRLRQDKKRFGETACAQLWPRFQNLALLYRQLGRLGEAAKTFRELHGVCKASKGGYADRSSYMLGIVLRDLGNIDEAVKLVETGTRGMSARVGASRTRLQWFGLAETYRHARRYKDAAKAMRHIMKADDTTFGRKGNGWRPIQEQWLAIVEMAARRDKQATTLLRASLSSLEQRLRLALATGTERANRASFASLRYQLDLLATLEPRTSKVGALALETTLNRKGMVLDAAASSLAGLRRTMAMQDQKTLDALNVARASLARLIVARRPGMEPAIGKLEAQIQQLERKLRKASPAFRAVSAVDEGSVAAALPKDGVLLEFLAYQQFHPERPRDRMLGASKYALWVLRPDGKRVRLTIPDGAAVDKQVQALRKAASQPESDTKVLAQGLYRVLLAPAMVHLGPETTRLFIAADGTLTLLPFAALLDDQGRRLVERFRLTQLTSGRDLVRLQAPGPKPRQQAVLIAAPTFPAAAAKTAARTRGSRSREFRMPKWQPLPGTEAEAKALKGFLGKGTTVLTGDAATEAALKRVAGPRVLHLATHGFFLPGGAGTQKARFEILLPNVLRPSSPRLGGTENPLLRSGLVLAGANGLSSGVDDGVLTALEAAGLDLWGTELVVLSACETGVGDVARAGGVHGLRRALTIAGARSLVMSLWAVDDEATRALMTDFYRHLSQGVARSEALRRAQLKLMRKEETAHPAFWAAFVLAGDDTPLSKPAQAP